MSCKYALLQGASENGMNLVIEIVWVITGITYYLLRERRIYKPDLQLVKYGCASGVLISGIIFFMILALKYGVASIVLPIAQMSFLLTFVFSMIFLKEKLTLFKAAALLCGVGALLLLA